MKQAALAARHCATKMQSIGKKKKGKSNKVVKITTDNLKKILLMESNCTRILFFPLKSITLIC